MNIANAENGNDVMDWQSIIRNALEVYSERTVTEITEHCFAQEFLESLENEQQNVERPYRPNREAAQEAGVILHDYIARFYSKFNNREVFMIQPGAQHVRDMLANLTHQPTSPIRRDQCVNWEHGFPSYRTIHVDLWQELHQFYTFVNENQMVCEKEEGWVMDDNHKVRGKYNALFRSRDSDKDLILYDWTRSALMTPGSTSLRKKTLQLNIYKYILEKYHGKNIVQMRSVTFHSQKPAYIINEIEDIGFRCVCNVCLNEN